MNNNKINLKALLTRLVPFLFYSTLIIFLFIYLRSIDFSKMSGIEVSWLYITIASMLALSFRYWGVYVWIILLRSLGAKLVKLSPTLIYVYAKSWLGRYIPGTAPWILGKIYFASRHGISKNKLAVSSLLEGSLQIIVQFLFALVLLIFDTRLNIISNNIKVIIGLGILACLTVLIPRVFNRIVSVAYKLVKHKDFSDEHTATGKTIAKGFGLYVVGSLISSLSLFFVAKALYPELGYEHIFFVMGASTLAGAVSMVAIFAPSGIGVREGIQLALLSIIMPTEIALVITIVTRLWSVAIDLVFFGISALLYKYKEIK